MKAYGEGKEMRTTSSVKYGGHGHVWLPVELAHCCLFARLLIEDANGLYIPYYIYCILSAPLLQNGQWLQRISIQSFKTMLMLMLASWYTLYVESIHTDHKVIPRFYLNQTIFVSITSFWLIWWESVKQNCFLTWIWPLNTFLIRLRSWPVSSLMFACFIYPTTRLDVCLGSLSC